MCDGSIKEQLRGRKLSCSQFVFESHDIDSIQTSVFVVSNFQVKHAQTTCARSRRAIRVTDTCWWREYASEMKHKTTKHFRNHQFYQESKSYQRRWPSWTICSRKVCTNHPTAQQHTCRNHRLKTQPPKIFKHFRIFENLSSSLKQWWSPQAVHCAPTYVRSSSALRHPLTGSPELIRITWRQVFKGVWQERRVAKFLQELFISFDVV